MFEMKALNIKTFILTKKCRCISNLIIYVHIYIYSILNIPYETTGVRIHVKACKFTCENLLFYIDRGCEQPFSIIGLKHSKKNICIMCFLCLKNLQTCGQYALVKD